MLLLLIVKDYHTSRRLQALLYDIVKLIRMGNAKPENALKEFNTFEILKDSFFTNLFKNMPECLVDENNVQVKGRLSL